MNNPHRGGNITKGAPHQPGKVAKWSFPLLRKPSQEKNYSLRVHPKSIFFASIEPKKNEENTP